MRGQNCHKVRLFQAQLGAAVVLTLAAATTALADDGKAPAQRPAYDFTDYLKQQEFEESQARLATQVTPTVVTIKGVEYLRLEAQAGSLYVPKVGHVTPEALEKGLCASSFRESDVETATVSAVALDISKSVVAYAKIVIDTIHRRCDGTAAAPASVDPRGDLEIGVSKVTPGRGRRPDATLTIFNRNLAPNLGVRSDF